MFLSMQIVNLVSAKPRVSKLEFFVAVALVALAQAGKGDFYLASFWIMLMDFPDISIERVAALAEQNELPEPSLDLISLPPSFSEFASSSQGLGARTNTALPVYTPSTDDPWNTASRPSPAPRPENGVDVIGAVFGDAVPTTSTTSNGIAGSGLPEGWWKNQETVNVNIKGQQGFILNRYTVYDITSTVCCFRQVALGSLNVMHLKLQKGPNIPRRYSEFVILYEILVRRYPFRLLPALREFNCLRQPEVAEAFLAPKRVQRTHSNIIFDHTCSDSITHKPTRTS
jgi:sorting nexin-8